MNELDIFWQHPVITEKMFYEQNKHHDQYFGFPWATVIDRMQRSGLKLKDVYDMLHTKTGGRRDLYTCCQHIQFSLLLDLFNHLNINHVYACHKQIGQDTMHDVRVSPCPLYAVNIEDHTRNHDFVDVDIHNIARDILYSFQGAYVKQHYMSDVRERVLTMKHPSDCVVTNTGGWHFERAVYGGGLQSSDTTVMNSAEQSSTSQYNQLLLRSKFSLCPSGSGPNSIRLWESLAAGSIPVLLSDTLELPEHELWDDAIIRVRERDVTNIVEILSSVSEETVFKMRMNCLNIYNHFKKNYINERWHDK